MNGAIWSLATIVGPILLLTVVIWAYVRNRNAGRENIRRAERGAKDVREEIRRDPQYRED